MKQCFRRTPPLFSRSNVVCAPFLFYLVAVVACSGGGGGGVGFVVVAAAALLVDGSVDLGGDHGLLAAGGQHSALERERRVF